MIFRRVLALLTLIATQVVAQHDQTIAKALGSRALQVPGSACLTEVALSCKYSDTGENCCEAITLENGKEGCKSIVLSEDVPCNERKVVVDYEYCNNYDKDIKFIDGTYAKFKNEELAFDNDNLAAGECRSMSVESTIDTCKDKFVYSLQLQGWPIDALDIDGFYCRSYGYYKIDIMKPVPTCEVSSAVTCKYTDDNSVCADFDHESAECETREVLLTYEMCNKNKYDRIELLPVITRAKFRNELLALDLTTLEADDCRIVEIKKMMDNCKDKKFVFSLKVEGWIENFKDKTNAYCFGWDFTSIKLSKPARSRSPSYLRHV